MVQNPTPICRISVPKMMKDQPAIYPKVKVREENELDDHPAVNEQKRSYLLSLKDLESLFLEDSSNSSELHRERASCSDLGTPNFRAKVWSKFPPNLTENEGKEHRVSPSSTAKVPKVYSPNVVKPSTSESQADKRCNKVNTRASSIPMPRAVLSSPENDLMIGKKNRKPTEKPSVLKNHNSVQSRHSQCKTVARHSGNENPICSRKSKETVVDSKCRSAGKNRSQSP
ncbi:uncharacterized protein LOC111799527 isoform X1 [Cucurbita pepo subsp. pepo]|uniref:uncharacterized protein LOC111799527 isoform X1 n=1 Tax=Cucurbita pepo subsp. pepo TaxID=3664 RepID=UPI000C9D8971|nr:uncharacterized protein LOC111799527 isoform X1 [Cucurbita pepo subsp. pepo]